MRHGQQAIIQVGRRHGAPFLGLNEKIADAAQAPQEASGGYNWRVNEGVFESRPGAMLAASIARPTSYAVEFDAANDHVRFAHLDAYVFLNERVRWTIVYSFTTPASFPSKGYLFSQRVTISAAEYTQGVYINGSGKVFVELVDSTGSDKTFDSGASVLSTSTNYVIQVSRYDTNGYLYWGEEATSAVITTAKGTTTALGKFDHPASTADHDFVLGADWNASVYSNRLAHHATNFVALNLFVDHIEHGWSTYGDPTDPRVALCLRFAEASGEIKDQTPRANHSTAENLSAYRNTSNAFVEDTIPICAVAEFTKSSEEERIMLVAGGSIRASSYIV